MTLQVPDLLRLRGSALPRAAWARLRRLARRELLPYLLLPMLLLLAVWGFAEVADEVLEGESQRLDEWVLRAVRGAGQPAGPAWLGNAARDVTALGSAAVLGLVSAISLGYLAIQRLWGACLLVLAALGGAGAASQLLKGVFERERPAVVPHLDHVGTYSFPSGHSMMSAAVYLTLGALLARTVARRRLEVYVLVVALGLTLLVGASRVYVGVHYPTDVVAGWLGGLAWASLCWTVAFWLQARGRLEEAAAEDEPP